MDAKIHAAQEQLRQLKAENARLKAEISEQEAISRIEIARIKEAYKEQQVIMDRMRENNLRLVGERVQAEEQQRWWAQLASFFAGLWLDAEGKAKELKGKIFHTERLMSNANLKPEHRLYLYAAAPLAEKTRRQDEEGRSYMNRDEIMKRSGLSRTTCYRAAKELEAAGVLESKTYTRQTAAGPRKDRFEKFDPYAVAHPEVIEIPDAPVRGGYHQRCPECDSEQVRVKTVTTVQHTVTCKDCGIVSILPMFQNETYADYPTGFQSETLYKGSA